MQLPRGSLHCSIGTRTPVLLATTQDIFARVLQLCVDKVRYRQKRKCSKLLTLFCSEHQQQQKTIYAQMNCHTATVTVPSMNQTTELESIHVY